MRLKLGVKFEAGKLELNPLTMKKKMKQATPILKVIAKAKLGKNKLKNLA